MQGSYFSFWENPWLSRRNTYESLRNYHRSNVQEDATPRQFVGYNLQYDFPYAGNPVYIFGLFENTPKVADAPQKLQKQEPTPQAVIDWLRQVKADIKNDNNDAQSLKTLLPFFELAEPISVIRQYATFFNSNAHSKNKNLEQIRRMQNTLKQECKVIKNSIQRLQGVDIDNYRTLRKLRDNFLDSEQMSADQRAILCMAKDTYDLGKKLQKQCGDMLQKELNQKQSMLAQPYTLYNTYAQTSLSSEHNDDKTIDSGNQLRHK